jgi:hypothetical protein
VLTAKPRRLLKQAVPVVILVMQVIDETNHAGALFRSDEQNGPPMNADKRRWNGKLCLLSAFIGGQIPAFRLQLKACKKMVNTSQFPERDVSSSLWIASQPMFKALNE